MADTSTPNWKLLYEAGRQALQEKKLQQAEQSFSAALQLADDFDAGDPRLAATLNALARIYSLQRRYLAAAALLNRLLEVTERTLGPGHVQVAGVLTNLAEMYTHLGAAREELELRERVLGIRVADPNADAKSLDRLRERVSELRAIIASQEPQPAADDDFDNLPTITTAERALPAAPVHEPVSSMSSSATTQPEREVAESPREPDADAMYRMSPATAAMAIAPWPGAAATGTTPKGGPAVDVAEPIRPNAPAKYTPVAVIPVSHALASPLASLPDHDFGNAGREARHSALVKKMIARPSLYSMAAGVLLVAGLLAARGYVRGSDDERESAGSVSLAATAVATPGATLPAPQAQQPAPEPTVADQPNARDERRARESDEVQRRNVDRDRAASAPDRPPRAPSSAELERTLRGIDGAVRTIDQRTKAATDSASALRLQAPTFKKVKLAEP